jgi:hypothetical protein
MKTNKLFRVDFAKVEAIYSVFKKCNVFTLLLGDDLIPVYDFSGNNPRSSLNSLRKYYPDSKVTFYCKSSFPYQSVPLPYHLVYDNCILFF